MQSLLARQSKAQPRSSGAGLSALAPGSAPLQFDSRGRAHLEAHWPINARRSPLLLLIVGLRTILIRGYSLYKSS